MAKTVTGVVPLKKVWVGEIGKENRKNPILYCSVGEPVVVTFDPSGTNALQTFKSVETVILLAVRDGAWLTEIDFVALVAPHPPVTEYEITAVPAPTPVTWPEPVTVATDVLLLLQVPPLTPPVRVNVTLEPVQTEDDPLNVPGLAAGLTAIILEELNVPQLLLTV